MFPLCGLAFIPTTYILVVYVLLEYYVIYIYHYEISLQEFLRKTRKKYDRLTVLCWDMIWMSLKRM